MTQSNPSPNSFMQQNERNASRTQSPRGKSPSGRKYRWPCKDYLKGTCTNSFCEKWHPPECLFYKTKSGCKFGEKCSYAHRQVDNKPSKRSKKNDDKSAVAMLKKHELHEITRQLVLNRDKSHDRPGRPDINRDTCHELKRGPTGRRSSNARQLGCVFQDMMPPKSILRKSSDMQKPIQRVKFTRAIARHTKIRDQNPSLGYICPGVNLISAAPTLQILRIGLRRRQSGKSKVPAKQRGSWTKEYETWRSKKEQHSSHLRKIGACLHQLLKTWGKRICCRLRRVDAYDQQKGLEWCWNGYFDEIVQSYDSHNRQWRSADAWRGNSLCQRIGKILNWKSSKTRQQYCRSESFAMKTEITMNGSTVKNHISLKTGFGFPATRRTSFLLWFQACQRVRLQDLIRQLHGHFQDKSHWSTFSSSASSSPTITLLDNETREREDRIESDISPVTVSTTVDVRSG